jgi:hypothetical protein
MLPNAKTKAVEVVKFTEFDNFGGFVNFSPLLPCGTFPKQNSIFAYKSHCFKNTIWVGG